MAGPQLLTVQRGMPYKLDLSNITNTDASPARLYTPNLGFAAGSGVVTLSVSLFHSDRVTPYTLSFSAYGWASTNTKQLTAVGGTTSEWFVWIPGSVFLPPAGPYLQFEPVYARVTLSDTTDTDKASPQVTWDYLLTIAPLVTTFVPRGTATKLDLLNLLNAGNGLNYTPNQGLTTGSGVVTLTYQVFAADRVTSLAGPTALTAVGSTTSEWFAWLASALFNGPAAGLGQGDPLYVVVKLTDTTNTALFPAPQYWADYLLQENG